MTLSTVTFQRDYLFSSRSTRQWGPPIVVWADQAEGNLLACPFFTMERNNWLTCLVFCPGLQNLEQVFLTPKPRTKYTPMLLWPTEFGIYVTKNPAWLDSNWMHVSDALDIYPMLPQQSLNVAVFCQNSDCKQEQRTCIRSVSAVSAHWHTELIVPSAQHQAC